MKITFSTCNKPRICLTETACRKFHSAREVVIDWGDEEKPRPHGGRLGMDAILKDARRGDIQAVKRHLKRDPSLLLAKSGGHNRTFLWEAVRGNRVELTKYLLTAGADPNAPGRIRAEVVVLLKPYCIALHYKHAGLAELLLQAGTKPDIYSACFLGDEKTVARLLKKDPGLLAAEQEDDTVWRVTALHFAVAGGHGELARNLIRQGAQVRPYSRLLFNTAARMKHPELLPMLVEAGADQGLLEQWSQLQP